jgi:hypothetical protein
MNHNHEDNKCCFTCSHGCLMGHTGIQCNCIDNGLTQNQRKISTSDMYSTLCEYYEMSNHKKQANKFTMMMSPA